MSFFETLRKNFIVKFQEKIPVFSVLFLFFFFAFAVSGFFVDTVESATPPSVITYQGKLLNSGVAVNATTSMKFFIYDDPVGGTLKYTAGGTIGSPSDISVPVSDGIFSVNLGAAGTNNITSTIFADNSALYLQVIVAGTISLGPRKQLNASPYALNSAYLMGYSPATSATSAYIPLSDANGNFVFSGDPQSSGVGGGSLYVNPIMADANETLFGVGVTGGERFRVDFEGDAWVYGNLTATGTATSSFTNVLVNDGITLGGVKQTSWPGGGSGDVVASTTNNFTGVNTFSATTTFNSTTTIFNSSLSVNGLIANPQILGSIDDGVGGASIGQAFFVTVDGNYAYISDNANSKVEIVDVSDPANPTHVSSIADGDGGALLSNPREIVVSGNYAYVAVLSSNALEIIDISNPKSPVHAGKLVDSDGGAVLLGAWGVKVAGNYAYVTARNSGALEVVNISNPANPVHAGKLPNGAGASLLSPYGIAVSGKYAYIADNSGDALEIVDISDPKNPVHAGKLVDGGGGAVLNGANDVVVSGKFAYVSTDVSKTIDIIDISDPTTPSHVGSYSSANQPDRIFLSGKYAFVPTTNALEIVDISSSTNPSLTTSMTFTTLLGRPSSLSVAGNYLYLGLEDSLAPGSANRLTILNVGGGDVNSFQAGTLKSTNLEVTNGTRFNNSVSIRGGLTVGNSGFLLNGDFSMFAPTSSLASTNTLRFSHTALFETNASSTDDHAFIFNTKNTMTVASTTYLFSIRNNGVSAFSVASNGNVHTTGSFFGSGITVGAPGTPGDLAEKVDIALGDDVEAGDVVVVDPDSTDTYRRSTSAYSQQVSGVISTNPTIIVGSGKTEHMAIMAMVGRVPIKVSTENGAIVRGDLLITATSTGYAMRYDPTQDTGGRVAGIVGVALESLGEGKGKIMGLVRTGWVNGQYNQTFSEIRSELSRLALGQSASQTSNTVTVSQSSDGTIHPIESDLSLNGFSLLSVRSIAGLDGKWHIDEKGQFTSTVDTSDGAKTLYALQSGESQYMFSGTAALLNGKVRVDFDKTILDIVDTSKPMSINLTLAGKAKGIYVSGRDEIGFDVEEVDGGTSNVNFDWLVFATRKNESETVSDASTATTTSSDSDSDSDHDVSDVSSNSSETSIVDDTPSSTPAEEATPDALEPSPEKVVVEENPTVVEDPVVEVAPVPEPAAT